MKLYATVQSERASKGQGGNEYIDISLKDENGQSVCRMKFVENGLGYELIMEERDEMGMCFTNFPCGYCEEREQNINVANIGTDSITVNKIDTSTITAGRKIEKGKQQKGECIFGHDHDEHTKDCVVHN